MDLGFHVVVRAYGTSGWRVYLRNGSCWFHTPPDAWVCLWGGLWLAPAWELQARREKGLASEASCAPALGLERRAADR